MGLSSSGSAIEGSMFSSMFGSGASGTGSGPEGLTGNDNTYPQGDWDGGLNSMTMGMGNMNVGSGMNSGGMGMSNGGGMGNMNMGGMNSGGMGNMGMGNMGGMSNNGNTGTLNGMNEGMGSGMPLGMEGIAPSQTNTAGECWTRVRGLRVLGVEGYLCYV
jgi:hypothetical protein